MDHISDVAISAGKRSRTSIWTHVIERIGLAMMGASCGLFVAAHLASAAFDRVGTLGFIFAMTIYGAIGGYLGIDIPRRAARARHANLVEVDPDQTPDSVELLSAAGTFIAAVTAMLSVYIVIFDEAPGLFGTMVIGFSWLFGVTMQAAAGLIARLRKGDANAA